MISSDNVFEKQALVLKSGLDKVPKTYNAYIIAFVACISGLMYGFDSSSMSVFIGDDPYLNFFNHPSTVIQSFITAVVNIGAFFGSLTSPYISEPFGRRLCLIICAVLWIVGSVIQSAARDRAMLIVGRIIAGWGIGVGSSVCPVYTSEISPRKIRGVVCGMYQFSITVGLFIQFAIGYGMTKLHSQASFRGTWGIQTAPGVVLLIGVFFLPESPRWLAKHGQWDDVEEIVSQIEASGDRQNTEVMIEISEIKEQVILSQEAKSFTYAHLFSKTYYKRTLVAVSVATWQQLAGMNAMMYYIVYIFQMAGYSGDQNLVPSLIQYIINVTVTGPSLVIMDKFGRRKLMLLGAFCMMVFQFAVAALFAKYSVPKKFDGNDTVTITIPSDQKGAARAIIACCYLFVASFAFSWGATGWVYCSEVWGDSKSRQRGASLATSANWIFNFAVAMFTPSALKNLTWKTYIIFATFCGCMGVWAYFLYPETKGKRLEEIGQMWDANIPAWKTAAWNPATPLLADEVQDDKPAIEYVETSKMSEET